MTDEKFVFVNDVKEKGITARSARHKRTHNGKGGAVKFPSDFMTRKEIQAMNGKVERYRLNDPMTWDEFKAMPDDLQRSYIKLLRERFGVPDAKIGEMLGAEKNKISRYFRVLGLQQSGHRSGKKKWDSEGWLAFVNGVPVPAADPVEQTHEEERQLASLEEICEPVPVPVPEIKTLPVREETAAKVIPRSGTMHLEGRIEDVLNTVSVLLGGAKVSLCVSWEVLPERACDE